MQANHKYPVGSKVYLRSTPYSVWLTPPYTIVSSREGLASTLYDLEFQYNGQPTLLKDYAEHNLLPLL